MLDKHLTLRIIRSVTFLYNFNLDLLEGTLITKIDINGEYLYPLISMSTIGLTQLSVAR